MTLHRGSKTLIQNDKDKLKTAKLNKIFILDLYKNVFCHIFL
jgi:hypothetical protein